MLIEDLEVLVVRKKIKNIHLRILPPHGVVKVSVPRFMTEKAISIFITSKRSWIERNIEEAKKRPVQIPKQYISGEAHLFKGKKYLLNIIESDSKPRVAIREEAFIDLYIKPGTTFEQKEKVVLTWYRDELKKLIPELIAKWEPIMGVKVNDWRIKKMKTRWGTCNIQVKRVWVNLELIKKPLSALEYLVVHEMTHLLERGHNARFKAFMDQFLPDWKERKSRLNQKII